jgi:hypothetical protein
MNQSFRFLQAEVNVESEHTIPAPVPAMNMKTTRAALLDVGVAVEMQPQAMAQTEKPRCIIV